MTVTAPPVRKLFPARPTRKRKINWVPYLFILPHLIFFVVYVGYPFFNGIYISFLNYD